MLLNQPRSQQAAKRKRHKFKKQLSHQYQQLFFEFMLLFTKIADIIGIQNQLFTIR